MLCGVNLVFYEEVFSCEVCESVLAVVLISIAGQRLTHPASILQAYTLLLNSDKNKWRGKRDVSMFQRILAG